MIGSFRSHALVLLTAVTLGLAFLIGLLTWSGAAPWGGGYDVRVVVPTAGAMGPGASVRIAGIRVGKVTSVERRGVGAVLGLRIEDGRTPLPEDSRAAIRLRTLVGENYVEVVPGRSHRTLPEGGVLPISRGEDYVEADEILSVLRGRTRKSARRFLQDFGAALEGNGGRLNDTLREASDTLLDAEDVTEVLDAQRGQVAALVEHVGDVMRQIGDRSTAVRQLAGAGAATFGALADRDVQLRRTLEELAPTLAQVRRTSGVVREVTASASPVVAGLAGAVHALRPAVRDLGPAAGEGRSVMRELRAAAPGLTNTAEALGRLGGPAEKALPALRQVLCELNPTAEYLRPYARDIVGVLQNMGSTANYYDATGHAARFMSLIGQHSFTAIPDAGREVLDKLQEVGAVKELTATGYQPYPKPGQAGRPQGGEGDTGPKDSSLTYQRVHAEC